MVECCRTCIHWEEASKKLPIDVRRVRPREDLAVEIVFQGRTVRIPAWEYETVKPIKLSEASRRRICLYSSKIIVEPWDKCENYRFNGKLGENFCRFCEYRRVCPRNPCKPPSYVV